MTTSSNCSSKSQSRTSLRGFKQLLKKGWNEVVNIRSKNSRGEEPQYKPRGRPVKPISGVPPPKPKPW
ncbi:hypothetical protein K435DRAFT_862666 [Dendrothele bispora CBS 962.96]|uniref:Uncharacterized protein n=1 Tax=Dendrothele bispora (strain CBS 962.96) TaxID=1314807 RepID=A0A4S8LT49_DENBC|nr:hypothetical protein K435DRAFT_862666 [Dendrothele bispora CBS 962.96]